MEEEIKKPEQEDRLAEVMEPSGAPDLDEGVFTLKDPHKIALSLKKSSLKSIHRKGKTYYQYAMSALNSHINRSGKNLPEHQKHILERTKSELKRLLNRQ